jgi:hypothetical protein
MFKLQTSFKLFKPLLLKGGGGDPLIEVSVNSKEENSFMYLRAIFCTFQISVDFYFVPVGGRGGGRGGLEKGRGLERGG